VTAHTNPYSRFAELFEKAKAAQPKDPNAMVLSTVGANGRPSSRVVLLKGFDESGFVFYTNTRSRKGRELDGHRFAALNFYWPTLDSQVRAEGAIARVSDSEADAYFATRARGSQLGAWASHQSEVLRSREELEARLVELERAYEGKTIPRPPHWTGYRLTPELIEFWHARPNRLHDRTVYLAEPSGGWRSELLNP
jgi:pyridoxamine 5'-phosphate oxidase